MIKWLTTWVMLCLLMIPHWWVIPAEAVWGVGDLTFDETNWIENAATAAKTLELVQQGTNTLTKLDSYGTMSKTITQVVQLTSLLQTVTARMMVRYQRWGAMFGQNFQVPCSVAKLLAWNLEFDQDTTASVHDSAMAQTLISDAVNSLQDVLDILHSVMRMVGQVQGLQRANELLTRSWIEMVRMQTTMATKHEVENREHMRTLVNRRSASLLSEARMAGLYGLPTPACS